MCKCSSGDNGYDCYVDYLNATDLDNLDFKTKLLIFRYAQFIVQSF